LPGLRKKQKQRKKKIMKRKNSEEMMAELGLDESLRQHPLAQIGNFCLTAAVWIKLFKPALTLALMLFFGASQMVLAQGNPFPQRGDQSLGNLIQNILVILTWLCAAVGIGSILMIPGFVFMQWDWRKLIWSGGLGLGGWAMAGSLAFILVNNQDVDLPDLNQ
jgi:hypothetical protein